LIAILADTHMPRGSRRLPDRCLRLLSEADALVHAGDFLATSVLEELETICGTVHAVHGNVDEAALRTRLPEATEVTLGGFAIAVVHDAGPTRGRLGRMRSRFPAADAVVFGHSHMPLHEREGDFQIFNPGSPTERRRAPRGSMGLLSFSSNGPVFEHVWL
jgi:putative phosphoesterase